MNEALKRFREQMKETGTGMFRTMMEEEYRNLEMDITISEDDRKDKKKAKAAFKAAGDEYAEDIESCVDAFIEDFIWQCDCAVADLSDEGETEAAGHVQEKKDKLFDRDILKKMYTENKADKDYEKVLKDLFSKDYEENEEFLKSAAIAFNQKVIDIYMKAAESFLGSIDRKLDKVFK